MRYEFGTTGATGVRLIAIVDRSGHRLRIERSGAHISRIVSPTGGRWNSPATERTG